MAKKVGKWIGSSYTRYKESRNPKSGIEKVNRYSHVPYQHVYGSDKTRKTRIIGEGTNISKPLRPSYQRR